MAGRLMVWERRFNIHIFRQTCVVLKGLYSFIVHLRCSREQIVLNFFNILFFFHLRKKYIQVHFKRTLFSIVTVTFALIHAYQRSFRKLPAAPGSPVCRSTAPRPACDGRRHMSARLPLYRSRNLCSEHALTLADTIVTEERDRLPAC